MHCPHHLYFLYSSFKTISALRLCVFSIAWQLISLLEISHDHLPQTCYSMTSYIQHWCWASDVQFVTIVFYYNITIYSCVLSCVLFGQAGVTAVWRLFHPIKQKTYTCQHTTISIFTCIVIHKQLHKCWMHNMDLKHK